MVAQGTSLTLVLDSSSFVLTITDPGHTPRVTTGSWTSSRDTMTLTPSGVSFSWVFDMNLSGSTLTLTGGSVEFDFNADGSYEQAQLDPDARTAVAHAGPLARRAFSGRQ